jgi:hypothetical protein
MCRLSGKIEPTRDFVMERRAHRVEIIVERMSDVEGGSYSTTDVDHRDFNLGRFAVCLGDDERTML